MKEQVGAWRVSAGIRGSEQFSNAVAKIQFDRVRLPRQPGKAPVAHQRVPVAPVHRDELGGNVVSLCVPRYPREVLPAEGKQVEAGSGSAHGQHFLGNNGHVGGVIDHGKLERIQIRAFLQGLEDLQPVVPVKGA